MLPRCLALFLLMVLTNLCVSAVGAEADTEAEEDMLRAAHLPTDRTRFIDSCSASARRMPNRSANIETLIAQLGSNSFPLREEASEELADSGVAAAGLLRQATRHADLEIRWRARRALSLIEPSDLSADVLIAALRVLARRKPARMAEVLLDYAPHAVNADVAEELCLTLTSATVRDGKADPILVRALTDKTSIKRGASGAALCRAGCRQQLSAVRRLLRDPDPHVRRRVALALLEARDKAAVPVLIELLAVLPRGETGSIESVLLQLAGDTPPKDPLDDRRDAVPTDAERVKYRDAWANWWEHRRRCARLDQNRVIAALARLHPGDLLHGHPRQGQGPRRLYSRIRCSRPNALADARIIQSR